MKIKTQKIKRLMKSKGMTLEELAKKMKIGGRAAAWYRIHNAKTFRTIESLAKCLGVKVSDII